MALHDDHPAQRRFRLLGADLVFDLPVVGSLARKFGATLAGSEEPLVVEVVGTATFFPGKATGISELVVLDEVVAAARARREGWEVDVRLRRADGTYHWLLERAAPIGQRPPSTACSSARLTRRYSGMPPAAPGTPPRSAGEAASASGTMAESSTTARAAGMAPL